MCYARVGVCDVYHKLTRRVGLTQERDARTTMRAIYPLRALCPFPRIPATRPKNN